MAFSAETSGKKDANLELRIVQATVMQCSIVRSPKHINDLLRHSWISDIPTYTRSCGRGSALTGGQRKSLQHPNHSLISKITEILPDGCVGRKFCYLSFYLMSQQRILPPPISSPKQRRNEEA